MQKSIRILLAAALIGLGVWGWRILFPSPERVIRSRLLELAKTASWQPNEGNISRLYHLQKLPDFFTTNVEVSIEALGDSQRTWRGRNELMEAAKAARFSLSGAKIELLDIHVTLGPDKQTAVADLTGKLTISGENNFSVQELNFKLRKEDGHWLIYRIETVKTLSENTRDQPSPALICS